MNLDLKVIAGIAAGILSVIAFIPYTYSIIKGETKPARATWFIWTAVTVILFLSYEGVGGGTAIWLSLGYIIGVGATALLSVKYGTGGWSMLDRASIIIASLAILGWWVTGSPLVALLMTMCADICGGIPTIEHSYHHPKEENKLAWILGFSANAINLLAVEAWDFTHAAYPIYLFLLIGLITWLVVIPRQKTR